MLKDVCIVECLPLCLDLPPQVTDGLHLIYRVQQIAHILDYLLLLCVEWNLPLQSLKCLLDALVVCDGAKVLILVDPEQSLRVLWQTHRRDTLRP